MKGRRSAAPEEPRAVLSVRVVPRASREEVAGWSEGVLRVRLTAPPVEGKANEALVRFLAAAAGLPRGRVALVSGETGRSKRIRFDGVTEGELLRRLGVAAPGEGS